VVEVGMGDEDRVQLPLVILAEGIGQTSRVKQDFFI